MKRRRSSRTKEDPPSKKQKIEEKSDINTITSDNYDLSQIPSEIICHILSYAPEDHYRRKLRLVNKQWFEWINYTNFRFGIILPGDISSIVKALKRYNRPISINIKKGHLLEGDDLKQFSRLTNLTSLNVDHVPSKKPSELGNLTKIVNLSLQYIPSNILNRLSHLTRLKTDFLDEGAILPNLVALDFAGYKNRDLTEFKTIPRSLTELTVTQTEFPPSFFEHLSSNCQIRKLTVQVPEDSVAEIPPISVKFTSLESLTTDIAFSSELPSDTLTHLDVREPDTEMTKEISKLVNLKSLVLIQSEVESVQLRTLTNLEMCLMRGQYSGGGQLLDQIPNMEKLTALEVTLRRNGDVQKLLDFVHFKSLNLNLHTAGPNDLSPISRLTALTNLVINSETTDHSLQWLTALTALNSLQLTWPGRLGTVHDQLCLTALARLTTLLCRAVAKSIRLHGLTALKDLTLSNIKKSVSIEGMKTLTNLTSLVMVHPLTKTEWDDLVQLTDLQLLYVECETRDADQRLLQLTACSRLTSFMCMSSAWQGIHLTCLTSLQSLTFGTKNPISEEYNEVLGERLPHLYEHTYFKDFMSQFASFFNVYQPEI